MEWPVISWNSDEAFLLESPRPIDTPISEEYLHPYRDRVARVAHLLMSDSRDASHVIQETFMKLSRDAQGLRGDSSLRILVFRVAVSSIRGRQRRWKWRGHRPTSIPARDEEAIVRYGFSCLPRRHRLVLALRDIEGLSYSEISEVLGLPVGTVKSRLMRARSQMLTAVMRPPAHLE